MIAKRWIIGGLLVSLWFGCGDDGGDAADDGTGPTGPTAGEPDSPEPSPGEPSTPGEPASPGPSGPPAMGPGPSMPSGADGDAVAAAVDPSCVPDPDTFADSVRPILDQRCGGCHGEQTDFGAPYTLLDYDGLVAGAAPTRHSDRTWRASRPAPCRRPATCGRLPRSSTW